MRAATAFILGLAMAAGIGATDAARAAGVSFEREVMAVISKAGCNAGACHGNLNGKGGLKLSLRGENPAADFAALVTDKPGRRVDPTRPERSLLVRKPTLEAEHEGGKRFEPGSPEHTMLLEWIRAGAKRDAPDAPRLTELRVSPLEEVVEEPRVTVKLQAEAVFSDGSVRDVTRLATYEPFSFHAKVSTDGTVTREQLGEVTVGVRYLHLQKPVRLAFLPARPEWKWTEPEPANPVDAAVHAKLRRLKMNPAPVCDDATFLRRTTLDLNGRLPEPGEARDFVADADPDKRAKAIDRLLARPEFADVWALKWADLLRVEEKSLDTRGVELFHGWLRESFAQDKPLDQLAREIVTARGSTYENAPANYWRALREPTARSEAVAQVFLGTRVGCAKCHNHPFERWTQDDYYRFAALFDRLDYDIKQNDRTDKFDKHQFIGEQLVVLTEKATLDDPRTKKPPTPGLLPPEAPALGVDRDRFEQLAAWMTAPDNALFAPVQANRLWFQVMGRGLVEPADDFRATNPATIPALLDLLTAELKKHRFAVKPVLRLICTSRTYQAASEPDATNAADEGGNFARTVVRRVPAESLIDATCQVLGVPPALERDGKRLRAVQLPALGASRKDRSNELFALLTTFGKPRRLLSSDVERVNDTSLGQAFSFISGPIVADWLRAPENRLARLADAAQTTPEAAVEELFWAALTRPPTPLERSVFTGRVAAAWRPEDRRAALEDVAWALLNSKEFLLRR